MAEEKQKIVYEIEVRGYGKVLIGRAGPGAGCPWR
jgi:hypothetical protein